MHQLENLRNKTSSGPVRFEFEGRFPCAGAFHWSFELYETEEKGVFVRKEMLGSGNENGIIRKKGTRTNCLPNWSAFLDPPPICTWPRPAEATLLLGRRLPPAFIRRRGHAFCSGSHAGAFEGPIRRTRGAFYKNRADRQTNVGRKHAGFGLHDRAVVPGKAEPVFNRGTGKRNPPESLGASRLLPLFGSRISPP